MRITKLEYQKKDPGRVSVYIDGKFVAGLTENEVVRLGIFKDQEVTPDLLRAVLLESDFGKLFNACLNFLSFRPRTKYEIRLFLKRKFMEEIYESARKNQKKITEGILEKLRHLGQLNDHAFALWFIDQRNTYKPKGKLALRQELLVKGLDRKIVDEVLAESFAKDTSKVGEHELALQAISKKASVLKGKIKDKDSYYAVRVKLQRFLLSRGFSWETVSSVLDNTLGKRYT